MVGEAGLTAGVGVAGLTAGGGVGGGRTYSRQAELTAGPSWERGDPGQTYG